MGGQPALVFDNNGNLIQRNLVAPDPAGVDAVMAQEATSAGAVAWMIDDNEGTPRDVVNNSSQVESHIVYAAFGQDVYESNSAYIHWNGFGGSHDDTYIGLNQNDLRWDDPATGKWLSQDPIDFLGGDGNLSRYVGNSPTNGVDPSGLEGEPPRPTKQQMTTDPHVFNDQAQKKINGEWYMNIMGNQVRNFENMTVAILLNTQSERAKGYILVDGDVVGVFVARYKDGVMTPIFLPPPKKAPQQSPFKFTQNTANGQWVLEMRAAEKEFLEGTINIELAIEKQITDQQAFTMKGEQAIFLNVTVSGQAAQAKKDMIKKEQQLYEWFHDGCPSSQPVEEE